MLTGFKLGFSEGSTEYIPPNPQLVLSGFDEALLAIINTKMRENHK